MSLLIWFQCVYDYVNDYYFSDSLLSRSVALRIVWCFYLKLLFLHLFKLSVRAEVLTGDTRYLFGKHSNGSNWIGFIQDYWISRLRYQHWPSYRWNIVRITWPRALISCWPLGANRKRANYSRHSNSNGNRVLAESSTTKIKFLVPSIWIYPQSIWEHADNDQSIRAK